MLIVPKFGTTRLQSSQTGTGDAGVTLTGDGTTAHTKGAWAQIIASSSFDAYGITIMLGTSNVAASTNRRRMADIGIGGSGSEIVLAPNLIFGNTGNWAIVNGGLAIYSFPVFIPAGTRIAGRVQCEATTNNTANVLVYLHSTPIGPGGWTGSRITAYGADTATSSGVSHSPGNGSYATATEITASSTNPIRYLQVGTDLLTDTTGSTARGLLRIGVGATPNYIVEHLPYQESTTVETLLPETMNHLLAGMAFDIPAATRLVVSAMRNATAEARGWVLYGVD